jgi:hypothetical protein
MMRTARNEKILLLAVCVLALIASNCGSTPPACTAGNSSRTKGCDEFTRKDAQVYKNAALHTASGWHPLNKGDTLSTSASGQAQVNLSDCWPGEIYIFRNSSGQFKVEECEKSLMATSGYCDAFGTWYVGDCADEFDVVWTGSAKITKTGTTFSVTYLPEERGTTLVTVLRGSASVEPVRSAGTDELGPSTFVEEGRFYFTMPDAAYSDVAGLEPRQVYPLEELAPVAFELGIQDWMIDVSEKAREDGVLPENWPPDLGGQGEPPPPPPQEGIVVSMVGGALNEAFAQEAIVRAVFWTQVLEVVLPDGGTVTAFIGDEPVNVLEQQPYDPDLANEMLSAARDELGLTGVVIVFPGEDELLQEAASMVMEYLTAMELEVVVKGAPGAELAEYVATLAEAGEAVMILER